MKAARVLCVVAVAALVAGVFGSPAFAAKKTDPQKFCTAVATSFSAMKSGGTDRTQAKRIQQALNKAAGKAQGSVKSATKTLAGFYGKIAKGQQYTVVVAALGLKYTKAAATFSSYVGQYCPSVFIGLSTTTTTSSGGSGDSSAASGTATTISGAPDVCTADRAVLDAAEKAFFALNGGYGDMDALVSAHLLPQPSQYHTLTLTGDSPHATAYQIDGC